MEPGFGNERDASPGGTPHLGGPRRHGAVHENRQVRKLAGADQLVKEVDNRLGAADAEGAERVGVHLPIGFLAS